MLKKQLLILVEYSFWGWKLVEGVSLAKVYSNITLLELWIDCDAENSKICSLFK